MTLDHLIMVGNLARNRSSLTLAMINLRFSLDIKRKGRQTALLSESSKGRSPARNTNLRVTSLQGVHKALGWISHSETEYRKEKEDAADPWNLQTFGDLEAKGEPGGDTEGMISEAGQNSPMGKMGEQKELEEGASQLSEMHPRFEDDKGGPHGTGQT